jgi:hypothetical protein
MPLRKDLLLPQFEVTLAGSKIPDSLRVLPSGCVIEITFLPPKTPVGYNPSERVTGMLESCRELKKLGYQPYPHLAARALDGKSLDMALEGLRGISDSVFLIAGDYNPASPPEFPDSIHLARAILSKGNPFKEIGFAAYPADRHPTIKRADLRAALKEKASIAREHSETTVYFQTQFCFDPEEVVRLGIDIRKLDESLTLRTGVLVPSGINTLRRLISLTGYGAMDIVAKKPDLAFAVTASAILDTLPENLSKKVSQLFPKYRYEPNDFLRQLSENPRLDQSGISGVYFYTMNNFKGSARLYSQLST